MQQQYLNKKHSLYFTFFAVIFVVFINGYTLQAQTVQTFTTSGSWTCPAGVTSLKIEAWGAGGGGGFATGAKGAAGGGGGGGAYRASNTVTVTPGTTYFYTIGIGGSGGTTGGTAATNGGLTCFSTAASCTGTILTSAFGGSAGGSVNSNASGSFGAGGNGGTFTSTSFNGGNGAAGLNGNSGTGGGGGGGASTTAIGNNTTTATGGTGGTVGGGNGGNGANNTTGAGGSSIGGGGAGGHRNNNNRAGGAGADGQIRIEYAGYCSYATSSSSYWIDNVITTNGFSNINNATTYSAGGYSDYSSTAIVSQAASGNFNFNVTTSSGTHGINIWVDWNKDYDFLDPGENVYASGGSYVTSASGSITIPALTAIGNYRMRIVADFLATNPVSCGSTTYTEAEDYTVQVTTPPTCYSPTGLVASASSLTSGNAIWSAPTLGTLPAGYQYVISTSNVLPGGAGTAVGLTTIPFTGLLPNTNYYVFVRSDCGAGDFSSWVGATFFTGYCSSTSASSSYFTDDFSTSSGTANITNTASGYSAGGYGNFTAQVVSQVASGTVSFSAVFTGGSVGFNIWLDWNNDLDFNDSGEIVYSSTAYVTTATGTFSIPALASLGNHRMRIVANGFNTNPSDCGSTTSSETEDYTLTVLSPLPCAGNPSTVSVFIVSGTSSTVSWSAGVPAPSSGYQYIYSTTNTFPNALSVPTGSVAAGITSVTLTGLTAGTTYYFWVRANCTASATGTGVWIGTTIFTQPTCAIGPGTGTTTLGCPSTISGGLGLSGAAAPPINCSSSGCANLEATFTPIKQTTSYTVASIPYAPPYQFNCMRNPVSVNVDDKWSPTITLPFNFCFYGNTYNKCLVGSNGVITFDTTANTPSGTNAWSISNNLPTTSLSLNSIFGVYHDIDPSKVGGEVGYELVTLNTGCRALVASWNNISMFSSTCNALKYTGMIVLYENTNIIDVYIKEKRVCASWNAGNAIVGIQNATGTVATVAPNRNGLDPDWTVPTGTPEAWRFTPAGANVPTTIKWYEGSGTTGPVVGTTATVSVCPAVTTNYTAEVTYTLCSGLTFANTAQTTVTVTTNKVWNGSVNTDWNVANNWTPNILPTLTESVNIPNVANKPVIGSGVNALACSINVASGSSLTINTNNSITVTNAVNIAVGGIFNIKNNASLVQVNNVVNSGNINMERIANLKLQDYCYWSSPVGNLAAGTFPLTNVSPSTPASLLFKWDTTVTNANGGQGNWVNTTENMIPGKGYIARAPVGLGYLTNTTTPLTANFIGIANNGDYTIPILRGTDFTTVGTQGIPRTATDDNWNLIGNPYPSAIGVKEFINLAANNTIVGGVKVWTHTQLPTNITDPFYQDFITNYFPSDYTTINLAGATSGPGDYKIGSGQGFMVLMTPGIAGTGSVFFNNLMRSATFANNQFYRTSNNTNPIDQNRIWLDLVASTGQVSRTLVGYVDGATNAEDRLYDMFTDHKPSLNFYSLIDGNPMIIQGKSNPFDVNDVIPMGIQIPTVGTYNIAIAAVDGIFSAGGQTVYLEDKFLNVVHNLTTNPYQFTTNQGIVDDRFVLRYSQNTLSTSDFNVNNQVKIYVNNGVNINSTSELIKNIEVFDVLGRTLFVQKNINKKELILTNLRPTENVIIVKTTLQNDSVITRKVIY